MEHRAKCQMTNSLLKFKVNTTNSLTLNCLKPSVVSSLVSKKSAVLLRNFNEAKVPNRSRIILADTGMSGELLGGLDLEDVKGFVR